MVDPCYGGVTASLAMLGDLIIGNPKIGFSGKRVIQDTVKEDLPKDFQTSEKQLEKGFVDKIVNRKVLENFDKMLPFFNDETVYKIFSGSVIVATIIYTVFIGYNVLKFVFRRINSKHY